MLGRLAREEQRLAASGDAIGRRAMHGEIAAHLAPLLREQHREQKLGAEPLSEQREQTRAAARAESLGRAPAIGEQLSPDLEMPVLDDREPQVDVALCRIGFRLREDAVQKCGVRLVLPVVLECVEVRRAGADVGRSHADSN